MRSSLSRGQVIWIIVLGSVAVGLLFNLIQYLRDSANRKSSERKIADIMLAVHAHASNHDDRVPSRVDWSKNVKNQGDIPDFFIAIAPYLNIPRDPKEAISKNPPYGRVAQLIDSGDPSTNVALAESPESQQIKPNCSYASNVLAFTGVCTLKGSYKDGLANTIGISTHYVICGEDFRQRSYDWTLQESTPEQPFRRATFADSYYRDALPVTNTQNGKSYTLGYRGYQPWSFQTKPSQKMCEPFVPQAYYSSGLLVGMMDASVRTLNPKTSNLTFWSAVTPNSSESLD